MSTQTFRKLGVLLLIGLTFSSQTFAGKEPEPKGLLDLNSEELAHVLSFLPRPDMDQGVQICKAFQEAMPLARQKALERRAPDPYADLFVQIPKGRLPNGTRIAAFETTRTPVTREFWMEIMGDKPPGAKETQADWIAHPDLPVTHVAYENEDRSPAEVQEFLRRLNERTVQTGCRYDLPTDDQLHYSIRGDVTGQNHDSYSAGVTKANVNNFVTHSGNSDWRLQPVGHKQLNAFGIELGNVWKLSRDIYDSERHEWGSSMRGGSFNFPDKLAKSKIRNAAGAGRRKGDIGFTLVRTCN